jgi:tetratricopeptide (TPR) repeat protein
MSLLDKLFPPNPEKLRARARSLMEAGNYQLAAAKLAKAAPLFPDDPQPWYELGFCLTANCSRRKDASEEELEPLATEANAAFERAIEIHEDRGGLEPALVAKASFSVGIFHQVWKDYETSIKHLQRAFELEPSSIDHALYLSTSLARAGRFDEAEQLAVDVLEGEPDDPGPLAHWKEIREMAGRSTTVDMDEQRRRSLYAEFIEAQNDCLDTGELAGNFMQIASGNPIAVFSRMQEQLEESGEKARAEAMTKMRQRHGIAKYQLTLIEEEGKSKNWGK